MLKNYIRLMRPNQWIKNLFVFPALLFSKKFDEIESFLSVVLLFVYFIIVSSVIYILNDIVDAEKDRYHPKKRYRPIASTVVSKGQAVILMIVLFVISILISTHYSPLVNLVICAYIFNNILYTFGLKNKIIIDVMMISIGFLLRVIAGALVINVYISSWIIICTFFLSMLMALGKRRNEIICLKDGAAHHRTNLQIYSVQLIDYMLCICVACTIITYSLYTILEFDNKQFMVTIIFVFYGIFRYIFLLFTSDESKMPEEIIMADKPLIINVCLFAVTCILILLYIPN